MLNDQYFCQQLLPDFIAANPETTAGWDVVFDARGHFTEPHTGRVVPLGTLDVRRYLDDVAHVQRAEPECHAVAPPARKLFPTTGPANRYGAVLFCEKEGFDPLFKAARLAERFDIAPMSTKGMPVTASRKLVDQLCALYNLPLFVLHDFDKSGFSIVDTHRRNTRRYAFNNSINVIDLGLRLADVEKWGLENEAVHYGRSDPRPNLKENGARDAEVAFLCDGRTGYDGEYRGRRVELNAFTSGDLIAWIETKLCEHGVSKVIPGANVLHAAWRYARENRLLRERIDAIGKEVRQQVKAERIPESLDDHVRAMLHTNRGLPWDEAVAMIAEKGDL
jgi:hypothetical protein